MPLVNPLAHVMRDGCKEKTKQREKASDWLIIQSAIRTPSPLLSSPAFIRYIQEMENNVVRLHDAWFFFNSNKYFMLAL